MREFPLTKKQIEICNYILKINNEKINHDYLDSNGYSRTDLALALKFLIDNKIISIATPVVLTEIGTKYARNGIVKYFKDQRRDEFLRSPIMLTILFFIPVIISISGTIISYNNSKKIKNSTIDKNQVNDYIDSVVQARVNEFNKLNLDKPLKDPVKHVE